MMPDCDEAMKMSVPSNQFDNGQPIKKLTFEHDTQMPEFVSRNTI